MINALVMSGMMVVNPANIQADGSCNLQLHNDLYASETFVALKAGDQDLWRINADGTLYIQGTKQSVTPEKSAVLAEYQQGVYQQTATVVEIMDEAMEMASYALASVFGELLGENHRSVKRMNKLGDQLQVEFSEVAYHAEGTYVVKGSEFEAFGDRLGETIEAEVESIVKSSMGSMLIMVGKALLKGNGSIDDRMAQFEERMEAFGENLEREMESRAAVIEEKADQMCGDIQYLAHLEDEIALEAPAFAEFRLTNNYRSN